MLAGSESSATLLAGLLLGYFWSFYVIACTCLLLCANHIALYWATSVPVSCFTVYSSISRIAPFILFFFFFFSVSFPQSSISKCITMSSINIKRTVLISFFGLFETTAFRSMFSSLEIFVKGHLERVRHRQFHIRKKLLRVWRSRLREDVCNENVSVSDEWEAGVLQARNWTDLQGSERISSRSFVCAEVRWMEEVFFLVIRERKFPIILLNGKSVWHLVSDNSQAKAHIPYEMGMSTVIEAQLYLDRVALMSRKATR